MYFTYVVRPGDAPEGRGPQFKPFWDAAMSFNLRLGFILQLIGYCGLVLFSFFGGNIGFNLVFLTSGDAATLKSVPVPMLMLFSLVWLSGSLCILGFRFVTDDDASIRQSRGFRSGTKALHIAALMDVFAWLLTAVLFAATFQYFEEEWADKLAGNGSFKMYALLGRLVHVMALWITGGSVFVLEGYHSEGTVECWGWTIRTLFKLAGSLELVTLMFMGHRTIALVLDCAFSLLLGAGLVCAVIWALAFEPVVIRQEVKFTQSAMRNEFYKSRNAMAYYGPPMMDGVEVGPDVMS